MKTASQDPSMNRSPMDRRCELRQAAEGEVVLDLVVPAVEICGSLLDVSTSGFRAAHESPLLETGQIVEFAYSGKRGKARVVWNRVCDGHWQSGFFILG